MADDPIADVTRMLADWRGGDDQALQALLPEVYGELRQRASRCLRGERRGHTLQTHDLVHEAFLRLVAQRQVEWQNRSHFLAIGARLMRRILVDHARRRGYSKRGGEVQKIVLEDAPEVSQERSAELVALDEALAALAQVDRQLAEIVELRYFGGLKIREIAELLGVSEPTVRRRFRVAKAWLYRSLTGAEPEVG